MTNTDNTVLLPCPFCGSANVDPEGWSNSEGVTGPACDECGASAGSIKGADNIAAWNRRASRTQEPAEWQVEAAFKAHIAAQGLKLDPGSEYRPNKQWMRAALRAASITPPAPERSKEEVGELSVADAVAQLTAAVEAEKQRNSVRDEMLATVIVNLEKSEMTAEFAVLLRDYVRAERAKLSALEPSPIRKGEAEHEVVYNGEGYSFTGKSRPASPIQGEAFGTAWQTSHTGDEWHFAREASFSPSDLERGIVKNVTPLYASPHPVTISPEEGVRVTDEMVVGGARGIWDAGETGVPFEMAPPSLVSGLMKQSRAALTAAFFERPSREKR